MLVPSANAYFLQKMLHVSRHKKWCAFVYKIMAQFDNVGEYRCILYTLAYCIQDFIVNCFNKVKVNDLPEPKRPPPDSIISPIPGLSVRHQKKLQDNDHVTSALQGASDYFPAFTPTNLYCMVTEAHAYKQLAQGCTQQCSGRETNWWPGDQKSSI